MRKSLKGAFTTSLHLSDSRTERQNPCLMYRKALTSDSLSTHGFFLGKNFPSSPLAPFHGDALERIKEKNSGCVTRRDRESRVPHLLAPRGDDVCGGCAPRVRVVHENMWRIHTRTCTSSIFGRTCLTARTDGWNSLPAPPTLSERY